VENAVMAMYREMSPREVYPRLAEFYTVDVRADHEFRGPLGHIRDSVLIPLSDLEGRATEIPGGRALLFVCRSGKRSGVACEKLVELDVGPVTNLAGGMIAWNRAQLPLDRPRFTSCRVRSDGRSGLFGWSRDLTVTGEDIVPESRLARTRSRG
jgi:rhodanese-related sulfurtransferase